MKKKIIIFGATGNTGSYLLEYALNFFNKEEYEIIASGRRETTFFSKRGIPYYSVDITKEEDFDKLPMENIHAVMLLSAQIPSYMDTYCPIKYLDSIVIGGFNVLEYCRKNGIKKVISTSSYADVRNAWKKGVALKETEPRDFMYTGDHAVYVISKNAANDVMEYYNEQHGMQCASFRLPPVYGVGPHSEIYVNGKYYKTGIQTFIENAEAGKDIEIWGDPQISRDIIYVKDVARAFVLALRSDKTYGLYNMTSGTELTLEEQVQTVIDVFGPGKGSKIVYRPDKPNNTPSFLFDMTKAKEDFGFVPEYLSYRAIMEDYKKELESGRWDKFIASRRKES